MLLKQSISGVLKQLPKDAFGNTTYQRVFTNHPRLSKIMIVSSSDGAKVTYLYGQNGKVVRMTDETNFLEMSANDIADLAGLQQPIRGNSFGEAKIPSSLPVENAAAANQSQTNYSETYKNDFPRINENDPLPPAQTQTDNSDNNQSNQSQTFEQN